MRFAIYAPKLWWEDKAKAIKEDCNGCGSELDLSGKLVPDTIYGLNIRDSCCCPHDHMYLKGVTKGDRLFSDCMFLYNMVAVILNKGGILAIPRLFRATKYFVAVVKYGEKSFFNNKKQNDESNITFKGRFK